MSVTQAICKRCGVAVGGIFCPSCGDVLGGEGFADGALLAQKSAQLQSYIAQLGAPAPHVPAPNHAAQGLFDCASKTKQAVEAFLASDAGDIGAEAAGALRERARDAQKFLETENFLEIALVGTIRAGKSTLINALLGEEYASVRATTETATVTKFKKGDTAQMRVRFYSPAEWAEVFAGAKDGSAFKSDYERLGAESIRAQYVGREDLVAPFDAGKLKDFISSKHAEHYFVKEVVVSYPDFPFEKNIMFVDTPGLGDPVPYRSKATSDYIKSAKVVLMCVLAQVMNNGDYTKILEMFGQMGGKCEKVYVLGTQYDTFNKPQTDWGEQKADWAKNLATYYNTSALVDNNIIAVSGHIALLCELYQKGKLDAERTDELRVACYKLFRNDDLDANLARLVEFANVAELKRRIQRDILDDAQRIFNDGVRQEFDNLQTSVAAFFESGAAKLRETFRVGAGDLSGIHAQLDEGRRELAEREAQMSGLQGALEHFERESKQAIAALGEQISALIANIK